jgi:hypothetical protein
MAEFVLKEQGVLNSMDAVVWWEHGPWATSICASLSTGLEVAVVMRRQQEVLVGKRTAWHTVSNVPTPEYDVLVYEVDMVVL